MTFLTRNVNLIAKLPTQREKTKNMVLELRTFVLKNSKRTFWYPCSQYYNEIWERKS